MLKYLQIISKSLTSELFSCWGIGKKNKNKGMLILCAVEDGKMRIETGDGIKSILPDALCGRILRKYFIPSFYEGNFSTVVRGQA